MLNTPAEETLRHRHAALKAQHPHLRIRDAAHMLGVSEVELLALRCGQGVTRLEGSPREIFSHAPTLGHCMALTRNEHAVMEKRGVYGNLEGGEQVGQVLGPDIDLRLFFSCWSKVFAVEEVMRGELRRSLQFFDASGTALHKIHVEEDTAAAAFEALRDRHRSVNQRPHEPVETRTPAPPPRADDTVDVHALASDWRDLKDTHAFFGMLRKHKVDRLQALRLVGPEFARPVPLPQLARLWDRVAEDRTPIMVFVGNPGAIEIHTGPIRKRVPMDGWMNIMDPGFNLHLATAQLASLWWVRKPTTDGDVHALELFSNDGTNVALFFGERKPGRPELPAWTRHLEALLG